MLVYKSILIGIILNVLNFVTSQNCKLSRNNVPGQCISIHLCKQAQDDLHNKDIQPDICHFNDFEPIVCCALNSSLSSSETIQPIIPTQSTITTKSTVTSQPTITTQSTLIKLNLIPERISLQKCKDYYEPKFSKFGRINLEFYDALLTTSAVGGKLTEIGEFPFMAAIGWTRYDGTIEFKCGGFLVEKNFIITAAHCTSLGGAAPVVVRTGGISLNDTNTLNIPIEEIFIHPEYHNEQTYNDIAIMKLKGYSNHVPACLWQSDDIVGYQKATAMGYGHIEFAGKGSNDLIKVELNIYKPDGCVEYYSPKPQYPLGLINSQLCAGDPDGKMDTCQGDSGGPMLIKNEMKWPFIIGITSFGSGCAHQIPSIYTRISSYLDWIEPIVWS